MVETWNFRQIEAGDDFKLAIESKLEEASIILLLISANFLASDYCWEIEMKRALERHERGDAAVVPIILRDCDWHAAPFSKLQALPEGGKPVSRWRPRDRAWSNVVAGIRKKIDTLPRNLSAIPFLDDKAAKRASAAAYAKVQELAPVFFTQPFASREAAAKEVQELSRFLTLDQTLALSASSVPGERLAAGIILRDKLDLDFALSQRVEILEAIRRGLIDVGSRVRYRYVRAAEVQQGLVHSTKDLLRHIVMMDSDAVVREEARRVLARYALDE